MSPLIASIIKTTAVTLVASKLIKLAGKPDFANVIKLGGFSVVGIHVLNYTLEIINNPPPIVKAGKTLMDLITWLLSKPKGLELPKADW